MDKFERVQQYCVNGELAIKSEGLEDTFKDIAVYSTLAMILFRKDQEKDQELTEIERGKGSTDYGEPRFMSPKHYEEEEICKICPSCGEENKNGVDLGTARLNECYDCGYKYYHAEALARHKYAKRADERRRSDENLAHLKSLMERDKLSDVEKLEVQRRVNNHNNYREDEAKKNEAWLCSQSPKDRENN